MSERVLFVDDEPAVLDGIRRLLHKAFDMSFATSGAEAIAKLETDGPYAAIVSDMRMPHMNGVDLLAKIAGRWPDTIRIMLTGNADQQTAVDAINRGHIYSFLNKPVSRDILLGALTGALRLHRLETAEKVLLEKTLAGSIRTLVEILSAALPEAFGNALKLRDIVRRMAGPLEGNAWRLDMAAMLLPIGWTTLPPSVYRGHWTGMPLDGTERAMVDRVPEISARLVGNIPRLEGVAEVIASHRAQLGNPETGGVARDATILGIAVDILDAAGSGHITESVVERALGANATLDPTAANALRELFRATSVEGMPESVVGGTDAGAELLTVVVVHQPKLLREGDTLAEDAVFDDGSLVLAVGMTLSDLQIAKLINLGEMDRLRTPLKVRRVVSRATQT